MRYVIDFMFRFFVICHLSMKSRIGWIAEKIQSAISKGR